MSDMTPGVASALSPMVRRILAPNPSVFTGPGTNTYLVGIDEIAVIDPGPADDGHLDAIAACGRDRIRWILVTHTHPDHSPGATGLKERTGAQVLGFDERDGFVPDARLGDGDAVEGTGFRLTALHTPGHASNHLCYRLEGERLLFSGDHIMSGSTVVIMPPDGDMTAYLVALERLRGEPMDGVAPGHGPWIDDPAAKVEEYLTHRRAREASIEAALHAVGQATIPELVATVYTDVPEERHPIATWSVWAHLRKLAQEQRASCVLPDDKDAIWSVPLQE